MEENIRRCKVCEKDKVRRLVGMFPGPGGNKKWEGGSKRLWSGNVCPECNLLRAQEVMRKNREKWKNFGKKNNEPST